MTAADRIAEIRQRLAAATPGPWFRISGYVYRSHVRNDGNGFHVDDCTGPCYDSEFIANAPADIAFLLAENEKLKATIADMTATHRGGEVGR